MGPSSEPQSQPRRIVIPARHDAEDLRFAYLNLRNHPRGQLMLQELVAADFVPAMVIDEDSTLAASGRAGQLAELRQVAEFEPAVDTAEFCAARGIPYHLVPNHNDAAVEHLLRGVELDLVVLGDTRILKQHIIDAVPFGIVNVHPGLLPDVRGNNPYILSIIHGLPQGVTAHVIDTDIDRGPILLARPASTPPGIELPQLIHLLNTTCAEIIVDVLRQTVRGEAVATPQPQDARLTFRAAPPRDPGPHRGHAPRTRGRGRVGRHHRTGVTGPHWCRRVASLPAPNALLRRDRRLAIGLEDLGDIVVDITRALDTIPT